MGDSAIADIRIDTEIRDLIPRLSDGELALLEESILNEGVRDALVVWDEEGILLDGYHRYELAQKHGLEYRVVRRSFPDRDVAIEWVLQNQLGRRNLTNNQRSYLLGKLYEAKERRQGIRTDLTSGHNVPKLGVRAEVAKNAGITERTVTRAAKFAHSLDTLAEIDPDIKKAALADEITQTDVRRLVKVAEKDPDLAAQAMEKARSGEVKSIRKAIAHVKTEIAARTAMQPASAAKHPILIVGRAEETGLDDESVDVIITSPPYNLGSENWPMGGEGREPRESGIGYSDSMPEEEYQEWQVLVFRELYRVAKPGASFFYNHKVRIREGCAIHPMAWIGRSDNPWTLRQEIIWDRGSTHNHSPTLFWPHDERIYWMTKGTPKLPDHPIGLPTVWSFHGPIANTWHPAPFSEELPRNCLQAVGTEGITVLDPFAGSCTTTTLSSRTGNVRSGNSGARAT